MDFYFQWLGLNYSYTIIIIKTPMTVRCINLNMTYELNIHVYQQHFPTILMSACLQLPFSIQCLSASLNIIFYPLCFLRASVV